MPNQDCVCVCVWNCTSVVASLAAHRAYCSVARQKLSRQQCRTKIVCVCVELYQCCSAASCPSCLLLSSETETKSSAMPNQDCVCVWNCTSVVASLAAHLAYCSVARQKLSRQQCRTKIVCVCVCVELYQCCSVASCPSCLLLSS
ncbi:hypothetical protein RRG08_015960 [Elysia crispata]|uniref:Uncharacterized protein n=1 Tax=Elysia crispata TaxID=231223 RepID=A0AAE1DCZ6_9GAST|nr:hypothetical protein RRG08_015960 [Elysia crispata]